MNWNKSQLPERAGLRPKLISEQPSQGGQRGPRPQVGVCLWQKGHLFPLPDGEENKRRVYGGLGGRSLYLVSGNTEFPMQWEGR